MGIFESEIIGLLAPVHVLLMAAAVTLVLLSGLAARVMSYLEDLGYRRGARALLRRSAGGRYDAAVRAEQENV